MDTKTKSGNTNKKSAVSMAKTEAPSQRSHQVKSINPPLMCTCSPFSCANYSSIVLSQAIEIFQRAALYIRTYIPTCIHTKYIHIYKIFERLVYISCFVKSVFGLQNTPSKGVIKYWLLTKPKQHPAPVHSLCPGLNYNV